MKINLKEDFHIHANYNDHSPSNLSIENIVKQSQKIGLEKIAITEHVRKTSDWIPQYLNEIKSMNQKNVIPGFEAKILPDGSINCPEDYMEDYFIVASFHNLFHEKEKWLRALEMAVKNPDVNVIGHLGPEKSFDLSDDELNHLAELIAKNNKIVEINVKYHLPPKRWIKFFQEHKVQFHLASDAHALEDIGQYDKINDLIALVNQN